jgi:UDP-GlcNAc:undecaprenyl-phosphate GlcNAc-1-phosphate transferase
MREYVLVLLVAAAVTYLLVPLVRRVAARTRAIHEPRARDTHTTPTPLLGGLAMYGGLVAGLLVASRLPVLKDSFQVGGSRTEAGLLLAGGFVVVVGFVDDRWELSAISKLAGQVAAAGILVWSGQSLPWLPLPNGGVFSLEPDLSVTLTILLVVVTINAINFIDGLDGLASGIVAVAALSFLAYSYTLDRTIGSPSLSLPAVSSALLAGMCLGFLPHNFYPARIFMGDIGAMLLGLLLAYGPISSTNSLDPTLLTNYANNTHTLDRFPTLLPLLVPAAIFVIPYADLMFAIIRRTRAGKPIMAADRQHLHHRLLNIGHSYRQSVLIMYLWAALFSVTVVSLSMVRSPSAVFGVATVIAVLALLPATMPRLRPWRAFSGRNAPSASAASRARARRPATGTAARAPAPARPAGRPPVQAVQGAAAAQGAPPAGYDSFPGYSLDGDPLPAVSPFPGAAPAPNAFPGPVPAPNAFPAAAPAPNAFPGPVPAPNAFPAAAPAPNAASLAPVPADPLPWAGRLPSAEPAPSRAPFSGPAAFPRQPPFPDLEPFSGQVPVSGQVPLNGQAPFPDAGSRSADGPLDEPDPFFPDPAS